MTNFTAAVAIAGVLISAPTLVGAEEPSALESASALYGDEIANRDLVARLSAPIKTEKDLKDYLSKEPENSPLARLSPEARQIFLHSLHFGRNGLGSFNYAVLQNELSVSEAYNLLSLFGVQGVTPGLVGLKQESTLDSAVMSTARSPVLDDHWCASRATCKWEVMSVCILGNC